MAVVYNRGCSLFKKAQTHENGWEKGEKPFSFFYRSYNQPNFE
jgi:hypothetical protein